MYCPHHVHSLIPIAALPLPLPLSTLLQFPLQQFLQQEMPDRLGRLYAPSALQNIKGWCLRLRACDDPQAVASNCKPDDCQLEEKKRFMMLCIYVRFQLYAFWFTIDRMVNAC
jgi:hypothetical protein